MARRPNYGFEKRSKELEKQKKRDEKAEKKRLRKEGEDTGGAADEGGEAALADAGPDPAPALD